MPVLHKGDHPKPPPIIQFSDISKTYGKGEAATHALQHASFEVEAGSFTAIMGPSGSGKSTILNIMGILEGPTSGEYRLDGREVGEVTRDNDRAQLRREFLGFIFQQFMLLPKATALGNVMMPGVYSRLRDRRAKAESLLQQVGLEHRMHHRPNQMSGGEMQRVAIARSLLNDPKVLLADEPTGNLDSKTGKQILGVLHELNQQGKTLIVVTHDASIAAQADTIIEMKDGRVQ